VGFERDAYVVSQIGSPSLFIARQTVRILRPLRVDGDLEGDPLGK